MQVYVCIDALLIVESLEIRPWNKMEMRIDDEVAWGSDKQHFDGNQCLGTW